MAGDGCYESLRGGHFWRVGHGDRGGGHGDRLGGHGDRRVGHGDRQVGHENQKYSKIGRGDGFSPFFGNGDRRPVTTPGFYNILVTMTRN